MRVLLIEDDRATAQSIDLMLKSEGFNVYTTDLSEEGVDLGKLYDYDIILLDLNLPDMPGFDVLKTLRVAKVETPILILTGNADIDNKVRGLGYGADDYMTKPFSAAELVARIHAVLRRSHVGGLDAPIEVGDISVDVAAQRVSIKGTPLSLGPTEYRLLHFFCTHPERAYTREQVLDRVWGQNVYVEERTVDVHIRRLRKALAPFGCDALIQTVRGTGYRFSTRPAA